MTDTSPGLLYLSVKHVYLQTKAISFSIVFQKARSSRAVNWVWHLGHYIKQNCMKSMADPGGGGEGD